MGRFLVGLHHVHHIRVRKLLDGPEESEKNYNFPMDELVKKRKLKIEDSTERKNQLMSLF